MWNGEAQCQEWICSPFLIRLGHTFLHMNMVTGSLLLVPHVLRHPAEKQRGKRKEGEGGRYEWRKEGKISRESCACYETRVTEINIHIPIQDCWLVTVTLYRTRRVQLGPGVAVTKERWLSLTCSAHYRQFHYNTLSETGTWHKRLSRLVHFWRVRDRIMISQCQAA